ncbi:MAG: class I SAM-dependent methyltransferase family protein [Candidatus Aenigmarchaeota archaeon]|nr:class I SAM-dependent methyltransferase family protein [Candidatus Aenigmarchaeota archaeon]
MDWKAAVATALPPRLRPLLPAGYQRVGDIVLVQLPRELRPYRAAVGKALLRSLHAQAVYAQGPVQGELRTPRVELLASHGSRTIHQEHGVRFSVDVTKVMFSAGNLAERARLTAKPGETVADLFAGIGYFSLGIARREPACRVVAVEKNPAAARLLRENVRLNKLGNVEVLEGDCRLLAGEAWADRVLMGYFPGTERFLPTAFRIARDGAVIHFHNRYPEADLWAAPHAHLQTAARRAGCRTTVLDKRIVKSLSPAFVHAVMDVRVMKKGK